MKTAVEQFAEASAFDLAREVTKFITGDGIDTAHVREGVRKSRRQIVSFQTHHLPGAKRESQWVGFLTYSEDPVSNVNRDGQVVKSELQIAFEETLQALQEAQETLIYNKIDTGNLPGMSQRIRLALQNGKKFI